MGLKDTIKETKAKLAEVSDKEVELKETALEKLDAAVIKAEEKPKEEKPVETKPEPKADDKAADKEEKLETKPEDAPKADKTDAEHARDRIAKKKEKDRLGEELATAQARIAALEASLKPVQQPNHAADAEPDHGSQPMEWTAWKIRQQDKQIEQLSGWKSEQDTVKKRDNLKDQAKREVQSFEGQLRPKYADYDDVKNHYARILATSIKIVNPKISDQQLSDAVENRLLTRASELLSEGYENPIEAMYLEARSLGYQPKKAEGDEPKEDVKPDLDKVAALRKRNAGMAGAAGGGSADAHLSPSVVSKMTNAEYAKLKPEQKKRILAQLAAQTSA